MVQSFVSFSLLYFLHINVGKLCFFWFNLKLSLPIYFPGMRSQVEHTTELKTEPSASQISRLAQDQLLVGLNTDVKHVPVVPHSMSPFVTAPMVAMTTPPTIVWLPYPSPPPSPTEHLKEPSESPTKQNLAHSDNGNQVLSTTYGIASVTSPSNVVMPLWRPW